MSANLSSIYSEFNLNVVKNDKETGYVFEDYRLDAVRLMLYRGEKELALPPKAVETLLALVENQGVIVSKDDLISRLWADTIVEESNLSHYLYVLRKTLGSTSDGKPFIETFRRRGYRFNGEVRPFETANGAAVNQPHHKVERNGNVLRFADWGEAKYHSAAENVLVERTAENRFSTGKAAFLVAVCAFVFLASLSFVQFKSATPPAETVVHSKSELTITRLTNGIVPHDATVSPDGNYFVYHETDGKTYRLWLQQIGQSNLLEIVPPTEKPIYGKTFSPDGTFVYFVAADNADTPPALYRVPTLGGAAGKISDNVNSPVSFSPDGREMVFLRFNPPTRESALIIASADGADEKILLSRNAEQETLGFPAWSPDGNLIAFNAWNEKSKFTISAVNLQTNQIKLISPETWDNCYRMVWTRDGTNLIFVGTKEGDGNSTRRDQIYTLSYPHGEARRLTTDGSRYQLLSLGVSDADEIIVVPFNRSSQIWQMAANGDSRTARQITSGAADGRAGLVALSDGRIAYIARIGDALNVWMVDTDGANQKQLFSDPPVVEEIRAAPDGGFFVFAAMRDERYKLFRTDADGANLRQLTFGNTSVADATISPDGNWIVYGAEVLDGGEWKSSLWKIPASGGEPILLTDKNCRAPHFSPDGKFISCVYGEREIYLLSATDGTLLKTFEAVKIPTLNSGARFSPDGEALVYAVQRKNHSNLWRQPLGGDAPQPLTDFTSGDIYNFAFSTDGTRLYVARGYQIRDAVLIKNFK